MDDFPTEVIKVIECEKEMTRIIQEHIQKTYSCPLHNPKKRVEFRNIIKESNQNDKHAKNQEKKVQSAGKSSQIPHYEGRAVMSNNVDSKALRAYHGHNGNDMLAASNAELVKKAEGGTGAFKLSPQLSALVGADDLPPTEVAKKLTELIKERDLYDPKNKQFAICDADFKRLMGVKRFRIIGMEKYLKAHILEKI